MLAFGTGPAYRRAALRRAGLARGAQVLDVGIGTGLVAREALALIGAAAGGCVGVDPSAGMMGEISLPGVELIRAAPKHCRAIHASSDFISMGYALRHIDDVDAAFAEFFRVLRPGGRVLVLEISKPTGPRGHGAAEGLHARRGAADRTPWSRAGATRPELWRYYWDTIEACIAPEQVMQALAAAGFRDVRRHASLGVFSAYTAIKPEPNVEAR